MFFSPASSQKKFLTPHTKDPERGLWCSLGEDRILMSSAEQQDLATSRIQYTVSGKIAVATKLIAKFYLPPTHSPQTSNPWGPHYGLGATRRS